MPEESSIAERCVYDSVRALRHRWGCSRPFRPWIPLLFKQLADLGDVFHECRDLGWHRWDLLVSDRAVS